MKQVIKDSCYRKHVKTEIIITQKRKNESLNQITEMTDNKNAVCIYFFKYKKISS